ncbi:hypothetical protein ACIGJO_12180 [Streptomyces sp. NPDC079020]|uniref:hypothetical protein n=1 Tax=Streptomyces sp. NPDC079020 TaxID=3365722 RepID=UPI0037D641B4
MSTGRTAGAVRPAAAVLQQISDAAGGNDAPAVRDDQFLCTRSKVRQADLTGGTAVVRTSPFSALAAI